MRTLLCQRRSIIQQCQAGRPAQSGAGVPFLPNVSVDYNLLQTAVNIGRRYGNLAASGLMPSRQTVARQVERDYEVKKQKLTTLLVQIAADLNRLAFQVDLWTCAHTKASYVTVVLQYFDEEMRMKVTTLCCRVITTEKTAVQLLEVLEEIYNSLGSSLYSGEHAFTTDEGSNLLKLFQLIGESFLSHLYSCVLHLQIDLAVYCTCVAPAMRCTRR